VYWNQTVNNVPYSNNFTLSFRYNYVSGIIDKFYQINGYVFLSYFIDNTIYVIKDLLDETQNPSRNTWYDVIEVNITDAPASFQFGVGIYIYTTDSKGYFIANPAIDYDDDGGIDGDYTRVFKVLIDDVSLVGAVPPSCEEVDLRFHAGTFETSIIEGSNGGIANIDNPSYWNDSSLLVAISSNVSISCAYEVKLLAHNFENTTWTTQPTKQGAAYSISPDESCTLSFFTYIGSEGVSIYENFTVRASLAADWENSTIYDPFLNDVTGQCIFLPGLLVIPTSLLDRLGWWQITIQSPNYANTVTSQIRISGSWYNSTLFHSGNITRTSVRLGTQDQTPVISNSVNTTWYQPDGSIWYQESVSSGVSGVITTTQKTLMGNTTMAGEWTITALWTNGTEVAFGIANFEMHHTAALDVPDQYETINTEQGLVISNFVYYSDADTDDFLLDNSVTITANWSGFLVPFTQDFVKNWWRGEFDTALLEGGKFIVNVTASRPYFDDISVQFIVIVTFRTTLNILNVGDVPIEIGLNEIFTVQINYRLLNGTGIKGAIIDVSHTGPMNGLDSPSYIDHNNGNYSVDIICDLSATYPITITLSKPYHDNASDTLTLIVGKVGTNLVLFNGTADVVLFGGNYTLIVEYTNSTGNGLPGADLLVVATTPANGLNYSSFAHLTDGYYSITLTPISAGSSSIIISASLLNHETQYATFTLTASGIPTILTSLPSSATIAINQTFTLQLRFQDEIFNTIDIANITILNPSSGLLVSEAVPVGNGLYNITIQALKIKTFDLLFRATENNYQSASAGFSLVVTEIQTVLRFTGEISSTTIAFGETYELVVYYERTNPAEVIQGANITVLPVDTSDLEIHVVEYTGFYIISIRGNTIGLWALSVVANKTDHRIATKQFFIGVVRIDTTVQGASPLEALLINRTYTFTFSYIFESNSSYIHGADVLAFGEGTDWISYLELGSGQYSVNLTPQELGDHYVILTFEKTGFETVSYRLTFSVERVPITVQVLEGLSAPELSQTTILVRITETDTGQPVSGIQVFCFILNPIGAQISYSVMNPTSTPGDYSTIISMPKAEGIFQLQITCEATNYILNTAYTTQLQPGRDLLTMLFVTTTEYYPLIFILGAIGVGLAYRRSARKRRVRENKAALAVKRRFDDVKSLLGVIVLHKESGLPVYSKILRDGLEETVISAFITAITSFRGEFDIEASSEEWGLIPISDIVRVISTNKLVCAFITTGNPSLEQRDRMIQFAKAVGFIFDDTLSDVPIVVLDHHTKMQFDALFEENLDGSLLRTYKLDETKKLPTTSCALERIARKQGVEFKLEELASEISSCGLEEGRVYKAIMTALEDHYLVTTDESPFASELIRASELIDDAT
jgi:hypothetical protein